MPGESPRRSRWTGLGRRGEAAACGGETPTDAASASSRPAAAGNPASSISTCARSSSSMSASERVRPKTPARSVQQRAPRASWPPRRSEEAGDDGGGLFPLLPLVRDLPPARPREAVEPARGGCCPTRPIRSRCSLPAPASGARVERAVVDDEPVAAGLLDAARDAVAVLRSSASSVFSTIRASVPCQTSCFAFAHWIPNGSMT